MKKAFKLVIKSLKYAYYFALGSLLIRFCYDWKFLKNGRYFNGKRGNVTGPGWKWVVADHHNCCRKHVNKDVAWPVSADIRVVCPENITFHPDDLNNFQGFGNYYQAVGKITIGRGTYIAPNVGIITANHDFSNLDLHVEPKPVTLGEKCWIGMNSVILPGVTLGNGTIVGAGSVVTKSFPEGYCVVAGNPAKVIRMIETTENA